VFPYPTKIPNTLKYDLILDCIRPEYINTATPFSPSSSSPSSSASSTSSSSSANKQSSNTLLNNILPYIPPTLSYLNTSSSQSRYIMLNPSLLHLTDYWGPFLGTGLAFTQLITLQAMLTLLSNGELIIPIDTVYNFIDVPKAFNRLYAKGVRGKLVIEMNK
ncbi:unnamed protein product, partial [Trichobilharzia regenti]